MTASLQLEYCGFECENPFFLAASPVARTGEMIGRAFEAGFGGAVTKSVSLDQDLPDHSLSPRFVGIKHGGDNRYPQNSTFGMGNIDFRIDISVEDTLASFAEVKQKYPHKMLIVSIKGAYQQAEWEKLATLAQQTGADAIELCLSCPDDCGSGSIGQNTAATADVIGWVQSRSNLPIIVKLTAHVASFEPMVSTIANSGAQAVAAVNTVRGIAGFDLDQKLALPNIEGKSTAMGLSGSIIRPLAQYCVSQISQCAGPLQIAGVGGITCAQDAVEYALLGAHTMQIATQVMFEGYDIVQDLKSGLTAFLNKHGYDNLEQIRGLGLSCLTPSTKQLSRAQQLRAAIDEELCIQCGRCYRACRDGAYQAISFCSEDRTVNVDREKCVGCTLCSMVCPVKQAINFTPAEKQMEVHI